MGDDDEFGDLYTDVLRSLASSVQPQADASTPLRIHPIDPDVNSDDEIIYGAADLKNSVSKSASVPGIQLTSSIQEKPLQAQPESGRSDSNIVGSDGLNSEMGVGVRLPENGLDFIAEDDDLNIVVEENENKDNDDWVEKDDNLLAKPENTVEKMGSEHTIPGISGNFEDHKGPNFEDEWDSDESEDDLQIVLNDNNGLMGMPGFDGEGEGEDNEAGELLVIVADNGDVGHPNNLDEHEWKGEEVGPGADVERKEPVDAAKSGGVPVKIGYSNQLYHHPLHSQFKYVRPGAAPSTGGIQGQVRPPISVGPGGGRGRGDWRPRGPAVWGPNTAGRGYGSGLDFTLPSHKTIFEVDIDGFEEKPWRHPGIDMSAFFNFGFIEDSWKDYCKQLELLRLGKSMQGKIHVYESDRSKQDYNRDLPPELAAAVGNQDVASENPNSGIAGEASSDIARSSARVPSSVPIGRPIPVETGSDDRRERLPSIDTRRPRMHDSDAIIEIVCQRSNDDDMAEQLESDSGGEYQDDIDDAELINRYSHESNYQTKGRGRSKSSKIDDVDGEKQLLDNQNKSSDSEDNKDLSMAAGDDEVKEDGKLLMPPPKKQISVEQISQENDDGEEDSKALRKKSIDDISRGRERDEDNEGTKNRHHISGKGREDTFHSRRGGPHIDSCSLPRHMKSENKDWRKRIGERGEDKVGSRQRDKRRKEGGEKEEVTCNHRESESSSHRKRDRNEDDANHYVSQKKEEGPSSNQKEGHNRNKQSREDKKRGRDDYKGSGRYSDQLQLKRRDRVEDEHRQEGSRKGKESESRQETSKRDFKAPSSSDKRNKGSGEKAPLTSKKMEEDDKDPKNNANAKAVEDNNSNIRLDNVERLKKRSERFKLPMPSEKEALSIKKIVREPLPSTAQQTESRPDSEVKIKPQRPARKRRWTGN